MRFDNASDFLKSESRRPCFKGFVYKVTVFSRCVGFLNSFLFKLDVIMLEPDCLKPKEVLEHLNALGYYNITPWQLQEFIHDLRKLIKYDQKKLRLKRNEFGASNLQPCESECSCTESEGNSVRSSSKEFDNASLMSDCSSPATSKGSGDSKLDELSTKKEVDNKENLLKPQSSFIRPWNLQAGKEHLSRNRRNLDPVSLYHHYKSSWKRHNIPGETNHSQLRWVIRNKMLGQEPQPRLNT